MTTESTAINYKIGNERLISVTENAARKLASLLEEKGKPEGALRLAVIGGGGFGPAILNGLGGGPEEREIFVAIPNVRLGLYLQKETFFNGRSLAFPEKP